MQPVSLSHIVDLEAQRLGLQSWEVINLIEISIQRRYMRQGRIVHVSVNPESTTEPWEVIEARETLSGLVWMPVHDVRPPNADAFQREVEAYVRGKESNKRWWLAQCKILAVESDHYLVEIVECDEPDLVAKAAVLPANRAGGGSPQLEKEDVVWAVIKRKDTARFDGAEQWQGISADYVASRTDSIFLRMLIKRYWHIEVKADINSHSGIVVAPLDCEIGKIIGPEGQYIKQLKSMTGLKRIVVVRSVDGKRPDLKLTSAIRQIVEIEGVKVRAPARDSDEWRLIVKDKDARTLIGSNGTNLRFIAFATGLKIKHLVRDA